jgi:hypothetical protein
VKERNMSYAIAPGSVVLCLDDSETEGRIKKGFYYLVASTTHEGLIVGLVDIEGPFAANRFKQIAFTADHSLRLMPEELRSA